MAHLLEVDYEKIFSPETIANLKNQSKASFNQLEKSLSQVIADSSKLLPEIIDAENGYRDELEMLAAQLASDAYPVIDMQNIRIDAKIVGMGDMNIQPPSPQDDPTLPDFGSDDPEKLEAKRRIINGITQGASIRGAFAFALFREYLNEIDKELYDKYVNILKLTFQGVYDNEDAIAMILSLLAQGQKAQGGESEIEYDDDENQFVIKARAVCFPMLVHEIVKGLYEIVGTKGFGPDKEKNQAIVNAVDKISNEPRDLQYGKFIFDAVSKLYNESDVNDARVRELFFTRIYKMPETEFISFIENAINNKLTPSQKQFAISEMKKLESLLKKKDAEDAIKQQRGRV